MSEDFDPYYQWLGIPRDDQPPNYYRLLSLSLFEDNDEAISNAADRQMAHLRKFQSGPRGPESQKLLNEIAAAKLCLLRPQRKAQYDAELKKEQAKAAGADGGTSSPAGQRRVRKQRAAASPASQKLPAAKRLPEQKSPAPLMSQLPGPSQKRPQKKSPGSSRVVLLAAAGGGVALLLIGVVIALIAGSGGGDSTSSPAPPVNVVENKSPVFVSPPKDFTPEDSEPVGSGDTELEEPKPPETPITTTEPPKSFAALAPPPQPATMEDLNSEEEAILERLTRAIEQQPQDANRWNNRKNFYGPRGMWKEALADAQKSLELAPRTEIVALQCGVLLAQTGDVPQYREHCRTIVEEFLTEDSSPLTGDRIGKACVLHPAALDDWTRVNDALDRAINSTNRRPYKWFKMAKALAEYRRGDYQAALRYSAESSDLIKPNLPPDRSISLVNQAVAAMSHYRLNDQQAAQSALAQAAALAEEALPLWGEEPPMGGWHDVAVAEIIYREAQATLAGNVPLTTSATEEVATTSGTTTSPPLTSPPATEPMPKEPMPRKAAAPSQERQEELLAKIKDIFKNEYAEKDLEARAALAVTMTERGRSATEDLDSRYVLLQEARRLASQTLQEELILEALALLEKTHEVDAWTMRVETADALTKAARSTDERIALVRSLLKWSEDAVSADRLDAAEQIAELAADAATRSRNRDSRTAASEMQRFVSAVKGRMPSIVTARETLKNQPEDSTANLVLGAHLVLERNDPTGFQHLAAGGDANLKAIAQAELSPPTDWKKRLKLAELWHAAAQDSDGLTQRRQFARAANWYVQALPEVESPTAKKLELHYGQALSALETQMPVEKLAVHCRLDERSGALVKDEVAGEDGRISAPGARWEEGLLGGALALQQGTHVEFPVRDFGDQFTIALWIKPEPQKRMYMLVSSRRHQKGWSAFEGFQTRITEQQNNPSLTDPRRLHFDTGNRETIRWQGSPKVISFQRWSHVAYVVDRKAGAVDIYLNGLRINRRQTHTQYTTAGPWKLSDRGSYGCFIGLMDDLRIYDRLLTAKEVATLVGRQLSEASQSP